MNETDFYLKLDEILELEPGTIRGGEELNGLEAWDSVAVLSFIALADSEYGVALPPKEIAECRTTGDLAQLMARHVAAAAHG
jgi:acyl carrier protein